LTPAGRRPGYTTAGIVGNALSLFPYGRVEALRRTGGALGARKYPADDLSLDIDTMPIERVRAMLHCGEDEMRKKGLLSD
jgi:hypothetical protein